MLPNERELANLSLPFFGNRPVVPNALLPPEESECDDEGVFLPLQGGTLAAAPQPLGAVTVHHRPHHRNEKTAPRQIVVQRAHHEQ